MRLDTVFLVGSQETISRIEISRNSKIKMFFRNMQVKSEELKVVAFGNWELG